MSCWFYQGAEVGRRTERQGWRSVGSRSEKWSDIIIMETGYKSNISSCWFYQGAEVGHQAEQRQGWRPMKWYLYGIRLQLQVQ